LIGPFESGGRATPNPADFTIFHRRKANEPSNEKAGWIIGHLQGFLEQNAFQRKPMAPVPVLPNVFRRDIFERAAAHVHTRTGKTRAEAEPTPAGQQ
jgi:hypothetical protein